MRVFSNRYPLVLAALVLPLPSAGWLVAQDAGTQDAGTQDAGTQDAGTQDAETHSVSPLDAEGRLVQFERDIAPILRSRCLECHGPDEAKADFRVDEVDTLMQYVEPEDLESSTLYTDYLLAEDEDTLMPPTSHDGPLSADALALIRVWIEEGAHWPDEFELKAESDESVSATPAEEAATETPTTLSGRIWTAHGYLHPATVHFPIALFLLGGLFVVLGWKWPSVGTQIPLACLLLGSVTAVSATLMGWAFAPEQGWGNAWARFDWDKEIDMHRWSGVIVAVTSVIVAITALTALWKDSESLTKYWKVGLLLLAGMVGAVGHQGGELSYGSDFYQKAFNILMGEDEQSAQVASAAESADKPAPATQLAVKKNSHENESSDVDSSAKGAKDDSAESVDPPQSETETTEQSSD